MRSRQSTTNSPARTLESRLTAYVLAAGGASAVLASDADAAVVAHTAVQPFGVNGTVNIDFNSDGQTDFQVDHDRYDLNGSVLDYLQIDKNDINGETNPLAFDPGPDASFQATPFTDGATTRNDANNSAYMINGPQGSYPAALTLGEEIGPGLTFDFQEGGNFQGTGKDIRANRLIDEDATQIDRVLGGQPESGVMVPTDGPNFTGLNGAVRYLGVKMELNNSGQTNYGWIGIRIDNEANATGAVVGYAYESTAGEAITAGDIGPVAANADYDDDGDVDGNDFLVWQRVNGTAVTPKISADGTGDGQVNGADLALWRTNFGSATAASAPSTAAVPEPASLAMAAMGGALLVGSFALRRWNQSIGRIA